jgi:DNA-binding transcriptional MerR regulator
MNVRILTLFDEEPIVPVSVPAAKKKRPAIKEATSEEIQKKDEKEKRATRQNNQASSTTLKEEKNYYTIGETATKFKVRTSHIRFWTVQFGMKVRTTRKGDRLYTPENIEQLRVIHHLVKEQGYTIAGAKTKLKELKNVNLEDLQKNTIIGSLKALRETLMALRNQISYL